MRFQHLEDKKVSYCDHFGMAMSYAFTSFLATCGFVIHAVYPDVCTETAGDLITYLHSIIQIRRQKESKQIFPNNDRSTKIVS